MTVVLGSGRAANRRRGSFDAARRRLRVLEHARSRYTQRYSQGAGRRLRALLLAALWRRRTLVQLMFRRRPRDSRAVLAFVAVWSLVCVVRPRPGTLAISSLTYTHFNEATVHCRLRPRYPSHDGLV